MLSPEKIIELIRADAPAVYDILRESYFQSIGDWSAPPTADELLEQLTEYSGNNHDAHYWSGRYAYMIEDYRNQEPIRVPFTESDIDDLREGENFHWTYGWVPLFIFNTDISPEYDPDSEEYDPSITI